MDEKARRTALRKLPYAVNVVTVKADDRVNGFAVSWISQCSFSPPMLMLAIKRGGFSYELLDQGRVFVLNVLSAGQESIAEKFFQPVDYSATKIAGLTYSRGVTGAPILKDAAAYIECEVERVFNIGGDHDIVIGRVVEAGLRRDEEALTLKNTEWQYGG